MPGDRLACCVRADLTVRIEVEATNPSGFDEAKVRTVSENATTLRFDQAAFEED